MLIITTPPHSHTPHALLLLTIHQPQHPRIPSARLPDTHAHTSPGRDAWRGCVGVPRLPVESFVNKILEEERRPLWEKERGGE
ncbi:hypothetical protein E2C01_080441 [Portunus trituberculatus]|uniref:Uncharacterized protein n=1 Tax=Portunus trituberculatus TaxID=210409 RepID=A0A5B7IU45_PORTR|nr:hypothetical protein [Portunus trituberculatus]